MDKNIYVVVSDRFLPYIYFSRADAILQAEEMVGNFLEPVKKVYIVSYAKASEGYSDEGAEVTYYKDEK